MGGGRFAVVALIFLVSKRPGSGHGRAAWVFVMDWKIEDHYAKVL